MWIPLLDFAMKNNVSLSTLRRHIKAKKIPYRIENGRYLLLDDAQSSASTVAPMAQTSVRPIDQNAHARELKFKLEQAQEEIAELKMLIALYEEKIPQQKHSF
jgi:hypothetical protein